MIKMEDTNMKKMTAIMLTLALILSLAACGTINELRDIAAGLETGAPAAGRGADGGNNNPGGSPSGQTDAPGIDNSGGSGSSDGGNNSGGSPSGQTDAPDGSGDSSSDSSDVVDTQDGTLLSKEYIVIMETGEYHMVFKSSLMGKETISDGYYKDGMSAVTMEQTGIGEVTVITKGDKVYYIMHDMGVYTVTTPSEYGDSTGSEVYDRGQQFIGSGRAEFDGKERVYEEYNVDSTSSLRYFFDGTDFVGVAIMTAGVPFMEMVILSFDSYVPAGVFDVPAGYTDMSGLAGAMGNIAGN
jgi:hypothetical protein